MAKRGLGDLIFRGRGWVRRVDLLRSASCPYDLDKVDTRVISSSRRPSDYSPVSTPKKSEIGTFVRKQGI